MSGQRSARPVARRLRVKGWLRTLSALHVGGAERPSTGRLTVALDGLYHPYLPGTGLAGALRAAVRRMYGDGGGTESEQVRQLWGWAEDRLGSASRVVVRDAQLAEDTELDGDGLPCRPLSAARFENRMSVGIDRFTGAAAHGFLHSKVVVPRGTFIRLELDVESSGDSSDSEESRTQLASLLRALRHRQVRLGAAKTRGMGKVELVTDRTTVEEHDLSSPAGLVSALGHGSAPPQRWDLVDTSSGQLGGGPPLPELRVRVDWHPLAPLMVRAAEDGVLADSVPYTSATDHERLAPVLPGSALKGRLRAHAERIERTVRGIDVDSSADGDAAVERSAAFRQQLRQLAAVQALFGSVPDNDPEESKTGPEQRGAGALTVDDCYATSAVPAEDWRRAVFDLPGEGQEGATADSADRASPLETVRHHGFDKAQHVAIDRWTGGAAEGLLFSVVEPIATSWEPLLLTIDRSRLDAGSSTADAPEGDAALALLLLVLQDLSDGHVPLGWGTHRGMGDISVDAISLQMPWEGTSVPLDEFLGGPEAARLDEQWRRYLDGGHGTAV